MEQGLLLTLPGVCVRLKNKLLVEGRTHREKTGEWLKVRTALSLMRSLIRQLSLSSKR
jgi:hypothetical protein